MDICSKLDIKKAIGPDYLPTFYFLIVLKQSVVHYINYFTKLGHIQKHGNIQKILQNIKRAGKLK